MRAHISELPDGRVSAEDFLDNDGIEDVPLKVALDLTIDGDRMTMDFSRSSPACRGPVNISHSTTIAACYVALKHVFGDVPANAGVLEPVEFVVRWHFGWSREKLDRIREARSGALPDIGSDVLDRFLEERFRTEVRIGEYELMAGVPEAGE